MSDNATNKHTAVQAWLQGIFADEPVPFYHQSDAFAEYLHTIMTYELRLTQDAEIYKDFSEVAGKDYAKDLASIVKIISKLGLKESLDAANPEADTLSTTANLLSLSSVDENSYVLALTKLLMDKEQTTADVSSLDKFIQEYSKELVTAQGITVQLESVLDKLVKDTDGANAEKTKSRDAKFLRNKAAKYQADKKEHELKLSKAGASRDLTHGRLVADHATLQQLKAKLSQTEEELRKFAALPPDLELAKVKVEVAKSELRDLEDELVGQIDLCHL